MTFMLPTYSSRTLHISLCVALLKRKVISISDRPTKTSHLPLPDAPCSYIGIEASFRSERLAYTFLKHLHCQTLLISINIKGRWHLFQKCEMNVMLSLAAANIHSKRLPAICHRWEVPALGATCSCFSPRQQ